LKRTFFITLILTILLHTVAAQRESQVYETNPYKLDVSSQKSDCPDTIIDFFLNVTPTIYASPNGGFVSGNNGYNDTEKLQLFNHFQNYSIKGVLVWFGRKIQTSGDDESAITLFVKHTDSTASSIPPFIKGTSDSLLASKSFLLNTIVASNLPPVGLNYLEFDSPVLIRDGYSVGIGLSSLSSGDTIAIYSSSNGDPNFSRRSWERWDGIYGTILDSWDLNIDLAIFPVVDCELNSILSQSNVIEPLKVYPNPASDRITVSGFGNKPCKLIIYDQQGKMVRSLQISNFTSETSIDISRFSNGQYYILVENDVKKFFSTFNKTSL